MEKFTLVRIEPTASIISVAQTAASLNKISHTKSGGTLQSEKKFYGSRL